MKDNPQRIWLFVYVSLLVLTGCLVVSCRQASPGLSTSPLPMSPVTTPPPSAVLEKGMVHAAQFRGAWASGYPYPVFFFDVPQGTTTMTLQEVVYATEEPLGAVHPRLEKVAHEIVWPGGATSQVLATNFYYDENQEQLLTYEATFDDTSIDTAGFDVFVASGVGIAYLGDSKGVNIFYNCASSTSIDYQELSANEAGLPTEAVFNWGCEGDVYEVRVETTWGKSDSDYNIDVITGLTATITRE